MIFRSRSDILREMINNGTIENELKKLILVRFKSMREFSNFIAMPYSTLATIFKRGVGNASITNIIRICDALSISADELADGRITFRESEREYSAKLYMGDGQPSVCLSAEEFNLLAGYRSLNAKGREYLNWTIEIILQTHHV